MPVWFFFEDFMPLSLGLTEKYEHKKECWRGRKDVFRNVPEDAKTIGELSTTLVCGFKIT